MWSDDLALSIHRVRDGDELYVVDFSGLASFEVDFLNQTIALQRDDGVSADACRHLIVNQIFPRILAHNGRLIVHAAAVRSNHSTLMLTGPSGAGKSTLAASFYAAGWDLLGDDAFRVESSTDGLECRAIYQSLRLFEDSRRAVLAGVGRSSPVAHYSSKHSVDGLGDPTGGVPQPLSAIIFVEPEPSPEPIIDAVSPGEACIGLVEHSFWLDPKDRNGTLERLRQSGTAAGKVPAFRLRFPRRYDALGAVRDAILSAVVVGQRG